MHGGVSRCRRSAHGLAGIVHGARGVALDYRFARGPAGFVEMPGGVALRDRFARAAARFAGVAGGIALSNRLTGAAAAAGGVLAGGRFGIARRCRRDGRYCDQRRYRERRRCFCKVLKFHFSPPLICDQAIIGHDFGGVNLMRIGASQR